MHLRVLTYNIRSGTDILGRQRLVAQAQAVRDAAPDLVLLQEVASSRQAERIAEAAGLSHLAYGEARSTAAGDFGNAILSRWPLHDVDNRRVPRSRIAPEARAVLAASVDVDGVPLHAIATHFGLLPGEPELSTATVLEIVATVSEPIVLGGDFNRPVSSAACHRRLRKYLTDCASTGGRVPRASFPSLRPVLRLDYVYVRDLRVCDVAVLSSTASDHRPLLAVLET